MNELPRFEVVLGTYEQFLLGYKYFAKNEEVKQTFAIHSHTSSIRSVCHSGNYLASGGADDRIFIYDLKLRKEHCILTHHNATINCVAFTPDTTHILSGSADGVLAITRVGNWQLEKSWEKPHKGSAVLDIAVHSSGKLALTLGADHTLATWNLVKGRQAYVINLNTKSKDPKSLDRVIWAPDGVQFALCGGKFSEIWSIEKGGLLNAFEHPTKITSCAWLGEDSLLVGYEEGGLGVVNTQKGKIKSYKGHTSRVKAVAAFEDCIISASSGGDVKIWSKSLKMLGECSCDCRITCLCVAPCIEQNVKIKKEDGESDEKNDTDSDLEADVKEKSESDEEIIIVPKKKMKKEKKPR